MANLSFVRRELTAEEAHFSYPASIVETCGPIPERPKIIGQPRAMQALEMGLSISGKGYNIFVSGEAGTGRSTAIRLATEPYRADISQLRDIAFVHNFFRPNAPVALTFPVGEGRSFAGVMKEFIHHLIDALIELRQADNILSAEALLGKIEEHIERVSLRFDSSAVTLHLEHLRIDLTENIHLLEHFEIDSLRRNPFFQRYSVNLLIDHSDTTERPLIFENHPTFANLFGSLDVSPHQVRDQFYLPFLAIQAGSILESAGGYLVINAEEMTTQEGLWESFKRFLTTSTLVIQNSSASSGIRPESVPLALKVVLVGSEELYDQFCEYDIDFLKLFKVSAELDYTMRATPENIAGTVGFIKMVVHDESLLEITPSAIAELLRYSALIAEGRELLTTQLALIGDMVRESDYWARFNNHPTIDGGDVLRALAERDYVSSLTESRISDEIANGELIISLAGSKVGVINGLAILDRGSASFGTPTVISATVAPGTEGIVNIEHEAGLSGEIHDKGLLILEGYLRKRYARNFPLSVYAGIAFEQSYAEVDGDSASSSELFALLSAIGEIPVRQDIAVTGSVNQMGEIQPVGGINEKIAGFFNICKRLGLSRHPGVIIPVQNIKSLILPYEVLEAVKEGTFHIYPIESIDEGMQILTDRPAGVRNQKGNFPVDSVNRAIEMRLKALYEISRPQN